MSLRCGVTKKRAFKSQRAALVRIEEIQNEPSNRNHTPKEFRVYQCEFCGMYHLTGKRTTFKLRQQERGLTASG